VGRVLNNNAALKTKVASILAGRTEFLHIPVGHNTTIDGWLIRPSHFDASRKYPIIVNVCGEPAGSTVNDSWGGNNRMLMAALADDGYLVATSITPERRRRRGATGARSFTAPWACWHRRSRPTRCAVWPRCTLTWT